MVGGNGAVLRVEWIDVALVANPRTLGALFSALAIPQLQSAASRCIREVRACTHTHTTLSLSLSLSLALSLKGSFRCVHVFLSLSLSRSLSFSHVMGGFAAG
jgi:hypothetical protein